MFLKPKGPSESAKPHKSKKKACRNFLQAFFVAPLARISIRKISPHPLSLAFYMRISIADRQISSRVSGISLTLKEQISIYLNIPSSTAVLAAVRPLLGGAAPFSSRQRRAAFSDSGKVYPAKLGKAERAKVGVGGEPCAATVAVSP